MASFTVVRQAKGNGEYEQISAQAEEYLRNPPQQGVHVVFAEWNMFDRHSSLRDLLCSNWAYPPMLWTETCRKANGYAGSARHLQDDNKTVVDSSWFQFLIKQMGGGVNASQNKDGYQWYEMGFHIYVRHGGVAVAFCFETPSIFQNNLRQALSATVRTKLLTDPMAALQCLIIGEVVKLYDVSIWTLRNQIRDIEKRRSGPEHVALAVDFAQLHDLARHIIHACEIVAVAVDTVTTLTANHRMSVCGCPDATPTQVKPNCPHNEMVFWLGLLQNLGRRAQSLKERLSNEINLVGQQSLRRRLLTPGRGTTSSCSEILERRSRSVN
ncbi:hypothetical protein, variant [Phialophora macrospora]|uniref:Uncharacterized protein n=1 Tax=Phialophora macrospora TaxID=1851006 RepID=A0A0D2G6Q3_9EURO|nr:hypothetical protein, variant [Phialophora macrospora]